MEGHENVQLDFYVAYFYSHLADIVILSMCHRIISFFFHSSISHLIPLKCHHQNESAQCVRSIARTMYKIALLARDDDDDDSNKQ